MSRAGTSSVTRRSVGRMDDKSLNLWRQIESCRRAKKLAERRGKPITRSAGAAANEVEA